MGIADFGAGAQDALQQIIKQKFIELVQRQNNEEAMRALDLQQGRDATTAELGRGRLANDSRGLDQDAAMFAEDTRQFNVEQPTIGRLRSAQAGDLESRPAREIADRTHDVSMEGLRNTNELGQIRERGGQELGQIRERGGQDRATLRVRPAAQPQIFFDDKGQPRAIQFGPAGAQEVPLPTNLVGKRDPSLTKTPDEIRKDAEARKGGALDAEKAAGGGGLLSYLPKFSLGGGGDKSVKVKTPDGQEFTFPNQAAADAFKAKAGIK